VIPFQAYIVLISLQSYQNSVIISIFIYK